MVVVAWMIYRESKMRLVFGSVHKSNWILVYGDGRLGFLSINM